MRHWRRVNTHVAGTADALHVLQAVNITVQYHSCDRLFLIFKLMVLTLDRRSRKGSLSDAQASDALSRMQINYVSICISS